MIEIVDSSGTRFSSCQAPNGYSTLFIAPCLNDDIDLGVVQDSKLVFQVPGSGSTPVTFYVHVLDWSGNARPDYFYDLIITGAN